MPRHLAATRPGTVSTVLEIDGPLVDLVRDRLALAAVPGVEVRIGDGRLLLGAVASGSQDAVLGDAFGGLAVPWHLTTVEAVEAVERVLRPGGVYVVNVIDYPPLRFARAEVATLAAVFPSVAVIAPPEVVDGRAGDNVVLVGSIAPIDSAALRSAIASRGGVEEVLVGRAAAVFASGAGPLTDDHAPVDQWLARSRR
jgi:hypothetical protein